MYYIIFVPNFKLNLTLVSEVYIIHIHIYNYICMCMCIILYVCMFYNILIAYTHIYIECNSESKSFKYLWNVKHFSLVSWDPDQSIQLLMCRCYWVPLKSEIAYGSVHIKPWARITSMYAHTHLFASIKGSLPFQRKPERLPHQKKHSDPKTSSHCCAAVSANAMGSRQLHFLPFPNCALPASPHAAECRGKALSSNAWLLPCLTL